MLKIEEHARTRAGVTLVHQDRTAFEQVGVALKREIEHGVEQRMSRTDEGGQRLPLRRNQRLLERDAFVPRKDRLADADQAVAIAHRRRNVRHLVAARLPLLG